VLKGPRALLVTVLAIAAATLVTSAGPAAAGQVVGAQVTSSSSGTGGSSAVPIGVAIGLVVAAGAGGLWWVFGRKRRT
jgi:hypothetical protein